MVELDPAPDAQAIAATSIRSPIPAPATPATWPNRSNCNCHCHRCLANRTDATRTMTQADLTQVAMTAATTIPNRNPNAKASTATDEGESVALC